MIKRRHTYSCCKHKSAFLRRETYGFIVAETIALITRGSHHAIGKLTTKTEMIQDMITKLREDQRRIIYERSVAGGQTKLAV